MLKITQIRRHGLERDCCWNTKTNQYYCRHYYYDCVERINFVRDDMIIHDSDGTVTRLMFKEE